MQVSLCGGLMETNVRPERLATDKLGPEAYAPPDRRPREKLSEADPIPLRRRRDDIDPANSASENLNVLIRRVSGASMEEIDRLLFELQGLRETLCTKGERVSREIAEFARLSHAAMAATKIIADTLDQWKEAPPTNAERAGSRSGNYASEPDFPEPSSRAG